MIYNVNLNIERELIRLIVIRYTILIIQINLFSSLFFSRIFNKLINLYKTDNFYMFFKKMFTWAHTKLH